jgi:hypothetical protein
MRPVVLQVTFSLDGILTEVTLLSFVEPWATILLMMPRQPASFRRVKENCENFLGNICPVHRHPEAGKNLFVTLGEMYVAVPMDSTNAGSVVSILRFNPERH